MEDYSHLNEITKKEFKVFFCYCNSWMLSNLIPLLPKYAEMINQVVTMTIQLAFYLIPTFVTTDSAVCMYGS